MIRGSSGRLTSWPGAVVWRWVGAVAWRWVAAGLTVAVVLVAGGCVHPRRASTSGTDRWRPGLSSPAVIPSESPATVYKDTGLDLCGKTDQTPLKGLSVTVVKADPTGGLNPAFLKGPVCLFTLQTADGHGGLLAVQLSFTPTPGEAQQLYTSVFKARSATTDGQIPGLGDRADGLTEDKDYGDGLKGSTYYVLVRRANMVVEVCLSVRGTAFTPKKELADRALSIMRNTLALIPHS